MHWISFYHVWGVSFKRWYTITLLIAWSCISDRNVNKCHRKKCHDSLYDKLLWSSYRLLCVLEWVLIDIKVDKWCRWRACILTRSTVQLQYVTKTYAKPYVSHTEGMSGIFKWKFVICVFYHWTRMKYWLSSKRRITIVISKQINLSSRLPEIN